MDIEYEVYVEVFAVQEWRRDEVLRTASTGTRWVNKKVVDNNLPNLTNIIYAAASDEFAKDNVTIRRKKE